MLKSVKINRLHKFNKTFHNGLTIINWRIPILDCGLHGVIIFLNLSIFHFFFNYLFKIYHNSHLIQCLT